LTESKYVFLLNITDNLFSFVIFLFLAREFSTYIYGEIITLLTLSTIFRVVFDLGLPHFIQRDVSLNKDNSSKLISNVYALNILFIFVFLSLITGYKFLFLKPSIDIFLLLIIAVFIYIGFINDINNKALSGFFDFKKQFFTFLISRVFTVIFFLIGLYVIGFDLNSLLLVLVIGLILNFVLTTYNLMDKGVAISFRFLDFGYIRSILKTTLPLGIAVIINFLYNKVDVMLIAWIRNYSDVAIYNIGYGIYKTSSLAYSFILVPAFSSVAALSMDKHAVKDIFNKYWKIISVICIAVGAVLFIISNPLISVLYGKSYADSSLILRILTFGILGMGLNNLTGVIINGLGAFKVVMYITLSALVLNVVLNLLFILNYGIIASSIITVITEWYIFCFELYYVIKILK
jgi:O-antigen/teichoic acid export membrane protein